MGRREKMVELAVSVAGDDSHGYSQYRRWPWEGEDFDCSSLMYWAAHEAGYDVPLSGYTGTMLADFQAAGFAAEPWDGNIWDCAPGDILLAHNGSRQHTEMYVGGGRNVGAHIAETGGVDGAPGDQTGDEIGVAPNWGAWDYVLTPPADEDAPAPGAEPEPKRKDDEVKRVYNGGCVLRRYYHPETGNHIITGDAGEQEALSRAGWADEGAAGQAFAGAVVPVYRMFNPNNGDHVWVKRREAAQLQQLGWEWESVPFFGNPKGKAMWRLYNPGSGLHHFTPDRDEYDSLVAAGWSGEGCAFHL